MIDAYELKVAAPAERAAVALKSSATENELKAAAEKTKDITAIADKNGRTMTHNAAMGHKALRLAVKETGEAAREDAVAYQKAVVAEQARLIAIIEPEEKRLLKLRDDFDAEQERVRQAEIKREQDRIQRHESAIATITQIPAVLVGADSVGLLDAISRYSDIVPSEEWQDYTSKYVAAYAGVVTRLTEMRTAILEREEAARKEMDAREAAQKRIEEERAELAKQQAAQAEAARVLALEQAELRRQMAESAERVRAEAARQKAEADAREAERQRVAAETKRQMEAQQAAITAQRLAAEAEMKRQADELAAKQAAFEAQQAAVQQAKEAAEQLERDHAEALEINAKWILLMRAEPAAIKETVIGLPDDVVDADFREVVTPPTLRLGQISERLGFSVTADFLLFLGFSHAVTDRAAKLYHERDFPSMCAALIRHVDAVRAAHSA